MLSEKFQFSARKLLTKPHKFFLWSTLAPVLNYQL